jgi:3-hydroxyacyl-[acyl-carrier-protein] dehydratase
LTTIKEEVEQYMTSLAKEGQTLTSRFLFPEGFIGFQGHFPEKKVLPGVCQIQCVLSSLERTYRKPVVLKEIVLAKYLAPVAPGEEITCLCSDVKEQNDEFIVKAVLSRNGAKISEFKLRLQYGSEGAVS